MTHPRVAEFRERLDALCFELRVDLHHEDSHGSAFLLVPDGDHGTCNIHIQDELQIPVAIAWPEGLPRPRPRCAADCNPTDGHTDACKLRITTHTGRSCSKAPNVSSPMRVEDLAPDEKPVPFDQARFDRDIHAVTGKEVRELANLKRELQAVRVLDAWAKKHGGFWVSKPIQCWFAAADWTAGHGDGMAPAEARIAAAAAILKEDPSLGDLANV